MSDLRYDGPDLEAETNTRVQGTLMAAAMIAEAGQQGRTARRDRLGAARDAADRTVWRDTPADQLPTLDDRALATRWTACARHHGDPEANETRTRIEAELDARDPATMRDYRSWRNAVGADPGTAMRHALAERQQRLAQAWTPLAGPGARQLTDDQLWTGWAAAHAAHDTPETGQQLEAARQTGEALLAERDPDRMAGYHQLRAGRRPDGQPTHSPADAAAATTGGRLAFGQAGWAGVRTAGVAATSMAARSTATAHPAAAAATAAVTVHRLLRRGVQP